MKNLLLFTLLAFGLSPIFSQVEVRYHFGFDTTAEQAAWASYNIGVAPEFYDWEFVQGGLVDQCAAHYYPVGGQEQSDNGIVSPVFDFSGGAVIDSLWSAFGGFGTPQPGDTIALYLLQGSENPALAERLMLHSFTEKNYMNDMTWRLTSAIDIPQTDGDCYIAFRYTTIVNWLDARIDEISLRAFYETAVEENPLPALRVFPNPCTSLLRTSVHCQGARLLDLQGKICAQWHEVSDQFYLPELLSGMYILEMNTTHGTKTARIQIQ